MFNIQDNQPSPARQRLLSILALAGRNYNANNSQNYDGQDNQAAQPIPVKTADTNPVSIMPPPPDNNQPPQPMPLLTNKSLMEGGQSLSPLAGLPPPPDAGIQPAPPIAAAAGQPVAPPSILAGVKPPSLLDNARARYESAIAAPVQKQSKWKDVLAYTAEAANNIFNPQHQVAYEGFGAAKHNREIENAARVYAPLQQAADDDLARQGKQAAMDVQQAQIGNYADLSKDRAADNQRNDKKLELETQKADAKTFFDNWRLTNADKRQATYADYVKAQTELGNKKYLSQVEYNNTRLEHDTERMRQAWETTVANNKTRADIADKGNATRERIANGSLEQKNLANGIRQKYTAAQIIQNGQKNFNTKEEINLALTTAGFSPLP